MNAGIHKWFEQMLSLGGSDLHLEEGHPPQIRHQGILEPLAEAVLTGPYLKSILHQICGEDIWQRFVEKGDVDFTYEMPGRARFRANYFRHFGGIGAAFRAMPFKVPTLKQLLAPEDLYRMALLNGGLVLMTGPTGSGKTTSLAAMVNEINSHQAKKIVTIEDPVEYVHQNKKSLVVHRGVDQDTVSFAAGLAGAIKNNADVVLVGRLVDKETVSMALEAAERGLLVFAMMLNPSIAKALEAILDPFPETERPFIRARVALHLKGAVNQLLLPGADGKRRWAAHEIMWNKPTLAEAIRGGDAAELSALLQGGSGIHTMEETVRELVSAGKVTRDIAFRKARVAI